MTFERHGWIASWRLLAAAIAVLAVSGAAASVISAQAADGAARKLALPVFGKPAPQTVKKAMWGPIDQNGDYLFQLNGVPLFSIYQDLGVGIYQAALGWESVAPTPPAQPTNPSDPAYRWPPALDQIIAQAQSYGIQVAIMLVRSPSWANGGHAPKWAPENPQDFGDFATAAARRYPNVHLWMIWGEPNRKPNFAPFTAAPPKGPLNHRQARAPKKYAQLLDAAYGGLKGVDASNLVIGGNTFTAAGPGSIHTYQWIRYMRLPNGKRPRMDMYGHNPFGFRKPNLHAPASPRGQVDFSDLRRLGRALNRAFPGPPLKLFLSEWGVPTDKKDAEVLFKVSRATQAKWIRAAFHIVRGWKRIYTLGWVHLVDNPETKSTQGLLDANIDPKPGYFAFKDG